jgi:hypothetical protein
MADTYTFGVSHVGKEGTGYYGKRYGRIDERTTVTVQANSLEEAKNKVKNSPEVARNKLQAARRQAGDETPRPKLVVNSIIKNPNTPDQKIIKETAFQKEMRARENKQSIQKTGEYLKRENISPNKLFRDGLITYQDKLKLEKQLGLKPSRYISGLEGKKFKSGLEGKTLQSGLKIGDILPRGSASPGLEGQNIKSQPGGARFTTPLGRFTGKKIPPKTSMNEGGIVKGARGGIVRQFKGGGKVRIF